MSKVIFDMSRLDDRLPLLSRWKTIEEQRNCVDEFFACGRAESGLGTNYIRISEAHRRNEIVNRIAETFT
jgi:hypothetical protein